MLKRRLPASCRPTKSCVPCVPPDSIPWRRPCARAPLTCCGRRTSAASLCVSSSMRTPARSAMPTASSQALDFTVPVDTGPVDTVQELTVQELTVQKLTVQELTVQEVMVRAATVRVLMDHAPMVQRLDHAPMVQKLRRGRPVRVRLLARPRRTTCRLLPKRRRRGLALRVRRRRRRTCSQSRRNSDRPAPSSFHRCLGPVQQRWPR